MTLDPRYRMARETAYADYDVRGDRHAVVLELADGAADRRNALLQAVADVLAGHGAIADAYFDAPTELRFATARVSGAGLQRLETLVDVGDVLKRFEYATELKPPRLRPVAPLQAQPGAREAPGRASTAAQVSKATAIRHLFVVIDYGCPFLHPLLREPGPRGPSTRVRALWDQQPGPAGVAAAPQGFSYGTGLSRAQLEAVIASSGGDEARAYQVLGYEALRRQHSHGAHALGMLLDPRLRLRQPGPARPEGDVLFVQLPQGLLGAPSRPVLSRCVIDALVWIESRRLPDERVILSLGGGSSLGPHDGSSMVEQALQAFTRWGPVAKVSNPAQQSAPRNNHRIYIAAGNGREEKLHAQPHPKPGKPRTLIWRLPPASELPATVELWLPDQADGTMAAVDVELFAPDGRLVGTLNTGACVHWPDASRPVVSMVSSPWAGRGCTLTLIRIAPTAAAAGPVCAPYGDWRISLATREELGEPVHAYIGRVKPALGFAVRTTQPTFVPTRRAGHVGPRTDGTLQGLATAEGVVRAGGFVGVGRKPRLARYSARGPSRDGRVAGTDLDVRVDDGAVLRGRRCIGNLGGATFRMDGTSVAAPLAARLDLVAKLPDVVVRGQGKNEPDPENPAAGPAPAPAAQQPGKRLVDPYDA